MNEFRKDIVLSALIRDADEKLYAGKSPVRNYMVFK